MVVKAYHERLILEKKIVKENFKNMTEDPIAVSKTSLAEVRSRRKCSKKTKIIATIAIISLLVIVGVIVAILLLCKFVLRFKYVFT